MASDRGFSLVELLVSLLLTLTLAGAVFTFVNQAQASSQAQPEAIDMQQRARVAADALLHDLMMAGAGSSVGALAGSLVNAAPPVVPRRMGLRGADAPNVARSDVVTLMYVPSSGVQTVVQTPFAGAGADLTVQALPNCAGAPVCGLAQGMTTMIFDSLGRFDLFSVSQVGTETARLLLLGAAPNGGYVPGDAVAEVGLHTYYFDAVNRQLRHYDGNATDVPVIDDVVGLAFEYFGEPRPPDRPKPPPETENCLYDISGAPKPLPTLATAGGSLAPLPLTMLGDGPWCGSGSNQFDVDLLRIRVVRVTLRVEATAAAFRANGTGFVRGGVSHSSQRWLTDYVITFDVAPRNLNLGR